MVKLEDKMGKVEPVKIEAFERLQIVSDKMLVICLGLAFILFSGLFILIAGAL